MTPEQWLKIPEQDLPVKLAEVLIEKPWKHRWINTGGIEHCKICREMWSRKAKVAECVYSIKIDWNTAMEWFRKTLPRKTILRQICGPEWVDPITWMLAEAQPKHYLIAAARAVEGVKE